MLPFVRMIKPFIVKIYT